MAISQKTQKELLLIARRSIETKGQTPLVPPIKLSEKVADKTGGVFVTLYQIGHLRGCIGILESDQPLWKTVWGMAQSAAYGDPRFLPVSDHEFGAIKIEISVLSTPVEISDPYSIRLGIDGVIVEKDNHKGVFLPQVATETGWNLSEFMENLCIQKAGLPRNAWQSKAVKVKIFQTEVFREDEG